MLLHERFDKGYDNLHGVGYKGIKVRYQLRQVCRKDIVVRDRHHGFLPHEMAFNKMWCHVWRECKLRDYIRINRGRVACWYGYNDLCKVG